MNKVMLYDLAEPLVGNSLCDLLTQKGIVFHTCLLDKWFGINNKLTLSELQRYLRKYHSIYVEVDCVTENHFYCWIRRGNADEIMNIVSMSFYSKTYESALEIGLIEAVKMI